MRKAVIITGAGGGIGQALCNVFQEAGYFVIGLDIFPIPLYCDAEIICDLRKICRNTDYRAEILMTVRSHLRQKLLHALINNAAVQILKPSEHLTVEDWHETLDVNLVAPFVLAQAFLSELEEGKGSIINIASIHSTLTKPDFTCYATSKAALIGLTKSMAVDLGRKVRINAICPAATATPMLLAGFEGKEELLKQLSEVHPLKRIAQPEEIAQVAIFLASSQASFINGASLNVDGGIQARLHDPV